MRYLLIISTLFTLCFASESNLINNQKFNNDNIIEAGSDLQDARKAYYLGLATQSIGSFWVTRAILEGEPDAATPGYILMVVGFLFQLQAWNKIGEAGEKLSNE